MKTRLIPLLLTCCALAIGGAAIAATPQQPEIGARKKPVLTVGQLKFHDLNGDGALQPYEDWRLKPEKRADDLLKRMTIEEKSGLIIYGTFPNIGGKPFGDWDMDAVRQAIAGKNIRFFGHMKSGDGRTLATASNAIQEMAEETRLGMPLLIGSDPRNAYRAALGIAVPAGQFTRWPEALGLGAIGDPALVRRLSAVAAAEFRAVGFRMTISPVADLFTDPRWTRGVGTFGDDAAKVSALVGASVEGYQGGKTGLTDKSVAVLVKHWVGYGATADGYDSHNPYGQDMTFPGGAFAQHLRAYDGAFAAKASGIMPTYSKPTPGLTIKGKPVEQVGAGFNKQLIDGLLRRDRKFQGLVVSDFKITDDCEAKCHAGSLDVKEIGMPWGVETIDKPERFAKALDAGLDQLGGVMDTDIVAGLVKSGRITEARIDQSAKRALVLQFQLGLFENPYVDPEAAARIVGSPESLALAREAQQRSMVLLKNEGHLLPLAPAKTRKVWLWKVSKEAAIEHGLEPVDDPKLADVAILRVSAPFTSHPGHFFGASHHEGDLDFKPDNADLLAVQKASAAGIPVVVSAYLDRPAILTPILEHAEALFADYGVNDNVVLDEAFGVAKPEGKLPIEIPSSMEAVRAQKSDLPSDSKDPLFPRGFGLSY
jgi:beta-glucosidase